MRSHIGVVKVSQTAPNDFTFVTDRKIYDGEMNRKLTRDDASACLRTAEISPNLLLCQMVQIAGVKSVVARKASTRDASTFEVVLETLDIKGSMLVVDQLCDLIDARYHRHGAQQRGIVGRTIHHIAYA